MYKKLTKQEKGDRLYSTYLKDRDILSQNNYKLRPAKDQQTYIRLYRGAKDIGMTNIAKNLAKNDLEITRDTAKSVLDAGKLYLKKQKALLEKAKHPKEGDVSQSLIDSIQAKIDLYNDVFKLPKEKEGKKGARLSQKDIMNMDINEDIIVTGNTNYKEIEVGKTARQQLFLDMLGVLGREDTYKAYGY